MKRLIVSVLISGFFSAFFTLSTLAGVTENDKLVKFSIEGSLDTKCASRPKFEKFSNERTESKIRIAVLCISKGVRGGDWPQADIVYFVTAGQQPEVIDVWLGIFSRGEKEMFPYVVVKEDIFSQYNGLPLKEVEFISGEKVQFPYEEIFLGSGERAEVYYITLFINHRVYRNHALVRIAGDSGPLSLWVAFMNQRFTTHRGISAGQNDPVIGTVRSTLPGIRFMK